MQKLELGGTKYIGKTRLLRYCEIGGKAVFFIGIAVNAVGALTGDQSWGKAVVNIVFEAAPFFIGAGPGAVIAGLYFIGDKTGYNKAYVRSCGDYYNATGSVPLVYH